MPKRKSLTKKIRFEVFKRDKFACQYCGSKAPDVVLNVDHIVPVAGGGDNELLNLITSCFACNSGKSDRPLTAHTEVQKQSEQLAMLAVRREQLEMLKQWRDELASLDSEILDYVIQSITTKFDNEWGCPEHYKQKISGLVQKFGYALVLEAVDSASGQYLQKNNEGFVEASVVQFMNMIPKVTQYKQNEKEAPYPDYWRNVNYIRAMFSNKFPYKKSWDYTPKIKKALADGVSFAEVKSIVSINDNYYDALEAIEATYTNG